MSLDVNIRDFESALNGMKYSITLLEPSVDEEVLTPLYRVINEYEDHLSDDISKMVDKIVELEDELDELKKGE